MSKRFGRDWGRRFWGPVLNLLIKLFVRVEVRSAENLPPDGAGIVYYNHIHWADPPLVCGSLARYAVPLAKEETSKFPFVGWVLRGYGVIFIARGAVDRAALQATWEVLRRGDIMVIAPEGTRSRDGKLLESKEGLIFIAKRVPETWFMPCAVEGTTAFQLKFPEVLRRPRVKLTYGRPFRLRWPSGADAERIDRKLLAEMTRAAMGELAALLPPEMRGAYAEPDESARRWIDYGV